MKNPSRIWRTGAVAVVMAALGQAGGAAARSGADERQVVRRQSPYGMAETLLRIEASARHHGMAVFARFEQGPPAASAATGARATVQVIVLASSQGGTPVLMADAPPQMEVPLSVTVRQGGEGGTEVLVGNGRPWDATLPALALDLADLNAVVGEALHAEGEPAGQG